MKAVTHLLDTNILSELLRNPQGKVAEKIRQQGEETVATSVVVAAEIRSLGLTLVTANTDEFSRVPNLQVENWLAV
ncbi:MAG: hypothetical protein JJT96_06200 [Opitutales bacterium]|nr:hypothetical protein [Opitutales bacterium]